MIRKSLLLSVLFLIAFNLCAQESEVKKHYGIALAEIAVQDTIVYLFDRYVLQEEYAQVTWEDIKNHFTEPWYWDEDLFSINQIGHPYQGSWYFTTARSANLNFWESAAYTAFLGSLPWEFFSEDQQPAYNDLITTSLGGVTLGEMFHRMFEDCWDSDFRWFSFILSPMEGFNKVVFKWPYDKPEEKTETIESYLFVGAVDRDPVLGTGFNVIYGNPFGHKTKEPFDSFEMNVRGALSTENYYVNFFSDGYIWSIAPLWGINSATTLGISLHYNFIFSKDINYSDNSIGLSLKRRCYLPNDFIFDMRMHINWLILGAAEYDKFISGEIKRKDTYNEKRDYDYGTGENVQLSFAISQKNFGALTLWGMFSGLHHIPDAVTADGTCGYTAIINWGTSYEHCISKRCSLGCSYEMLCKNGFYITADNVTDIYNYYSVYFKLKIR